MALTPNARLDHYAIGAPLGAGGMGEVYRSRDTRLDREVAIKVLLGVFPADADRLRRFEQEGRAPHPRSTIRISSRYTTSELTRARPTSYRSCSTERNFARG